MAKRQIRNYVFQPGVSVTSNAYPYAYTLLSNNKTFIQAEATAWIARQVTKGAQFTPSTATYNPATGVMVLTIGTHSLGVGDIITIATGGITFRCGLDGFTTLHSYPRASGAPNAAGTDPYFNSAIFITAVSSNTITVNVGISSNTSAHVFVSAISNAVTSGFLGYIYDSPKCQRDIGYVIDAYVNDIRYGGNVETRYVSSRYWDGNIPQVDGSRIPEIATHFTIRNLINNYIFTNTEQPLPLQTSIPQFTISNNAEVGTASRITTLSGQLIATIKGGLNSLPAKSPGVGYAQIPGKWAGAQLLLITNTTANIIIYNFGDSTYAGTLIEFNTGNENDSFPSILQAADGYTVVHFAYDTSAMSTADEVSILVEEDFLIVRPHQFGTDAVERMRVGAPQSMLDADFEYGLQPTKWQAIGLLRNYPAVYEVPGTDTPVISVVTDASSATGGIGSSLITVTTATNHGFVVGDPITIRALANSVNGFGRAEGSFLVNSVPTSLTFTFYAKSKVGTIPGTVLATTYTQLRKGGFYTGAQVGQPTLSVQSNGLGGSFTVNLNTPAGNDALPFTGSAPSIGAPLSGVGIVLGTQVTGVTGSGGASVTTRVSNDAAIGETSLVVNTVSGVIVGQAVDNGTSDAIFVTGIGLGDNPNEVNFSAPITAARIGDQAAYTNRTGSNITPAGSSAAFTINRINGSYVTTVTSAGAGYAVNDRILILGSNLGGADGVNDATIRISSVNPSTGAIVTVITTGTGVSSNATYTGVTGTNQTPVGTSATFNITRGYNGAYTASVGAGGSGYQVGDRILIQGTSLGGASPANDVTVGIDSVGAGGVVTSASANGFGVPYDTTYTAIASGANQPGTGTGQSFNVSRAAGGYTATVVSGGSGFIVGNRIGIIGTAVSGVAGTNDVNILITGVSGGAITTITVSGTAVAGTQSYTGLTGTNRPGIGSNGKFDITTTNGTYTVAISDSGQDYVANDKIKIIGTDIGGDTPANDLTITVATVTSGSIGNIVTVSIAGVAKTAITYSGLPGTNVTPSGLAGTFTVTRTAGVYSVDVIEDGGIGYKIGDRILVLGTALGGASPLNDLIITVDTVSGSEITGVTTSGTGFSGNATYIGQTGNNVVPVGVDASFDISRADGSYSVSINLPGTGYAVYDKVRILGTTIGGISPGNNAIVLVTGVDGAGAISSATISGTAVAGSPIIFYSTVTISQVTTQLIPVGTNITYGAIATIQVDFPSDHGFVPGSTILVDITSTGTNHALAKGPFFVTGVPTPTRLTYVTRASGTVDTGVALTGIMYARPDTFFTHRPFDGGVQLGTGGPAHGAQAIRMSKKYIRYQSGKGIMYTTGALFSPSYDIRAISSTGLLAGSIITVTTDDVDHGLQVGSEVGIEGIVTAGYNHAPYVVTNIIDERNFTVAAYSVLGSTTGELGDQPLCVLRKFHGATVRAGTFDEQNGIYWQFDGERMAIGRRTATRQLAGTISVNTNSNAVTGSNTRFMDQITAGDRIVIRGMTHLVSRVISQTSLTINPDFRGVNNVTAVKSVIIEDLLVPQSEWNLDACDGSGESGYTLNPYKMQMIGLEWTWYGAGFINYMLRGPDGNYVYCHRIKNNNVNNEAYMRTGNMPVRYEVINEGARSKLYGAMTTTQTALTVYDGTYFPSAGTLYIDAEMITYTGKTGNVLTGLTRGVSISNFVAGSQRVYTGSSAAVHADKTGVILISNTATPQISHWGSAFITDGLFDQDRGYIFNYVASSLEVTTTRQTAFLLRLAPSVSNAIVGDLGERELINRAQLLLNGIEITSEASAVGGIVIEGVLNPQNYPLDPGNIIWNGLSGQAQGGQPSFAQVASGGSVNWASGITQTTATATTIGTFTASFTLLYSAGNNVNYAYADTTSYNNSGAIVGAIVNDGKFPAGTTITGSTNYGSYTQVNFSQRGNNVNAGQSITVNLGGTLTRTNFLYFTTTSWLALGAQIGQELQDAKFPAGTKLTSVSALSQFGGSQYYRVGFSQSSNTGVTGGSTVTFLFGQPPYALPGEQVFSFISAPGTSNNLNLGELKELTNTTLGGRGAFPNGPDVLAINVYKTAGSATISNIIIRWGEAQA